MTGLGHALEERRFTTQNKHLWNLTAYTVLDIPVAFVKFPAKERDQPFLILFFGFSFLFFRGLLLK